MSFNKRLASSERIVGSQFKVKTFTGNRPNSQSITGVGFEPSLVIAKLLSASGYGAVAANSVRGAQKFVDFTNTSVEVSASNSLTSFDSDGFSVGGYGNWNGGLSGANGSMISFNFKKGNDFTGNSNGSITSSGNANNDLGFSIVEYTGNATAGATVGHGLNAAPEFILIKCVSRSGDHHVVYSAFDLDTDADFLNLEVAFNNPAGFGYGGGSTFWNNTSPTSSVFSLGNIGDVNASGQTFIAYCFTSKAGISKIGNYAGSSSNQQITCGFQPSFVMLKNRDLARPYTIFQDQTTDLIYVNSSGGGVDNRNTYLTFNSTGFELVGGISTYVHAAGSNWLFLAFK